MSINRVELSQALFIAVKHRKMGEIKRLLDAGVSVSWKCPITGNTALHLAAEMNDFEIALLLLDSNADATVKNKELTTPISIAAYASFWDFVVKFARRRYSNGSDEYGSALLSAASANQTDAVAALLRAGAITAWGTISHKDSALHFAVKNNNPDMVRDLRSYYANETKKNASNKNPVEIAIEYANETQDFGVVHAFSEYVPKVGMGKIIIEDLEDVIQTISTRSALPYFQRYDWIARCEYEYSNHGNRCGHYKDCILEQILALNDPALKQKALWQALDSTTFLGKFFKQKTGFFEPSLKSGHLKKIVSALKNVLTMDELIIDETVKDNLHHNVDVVKNFPQLISKYPIYRATKTITAVSPANIATDAWFQQVFGKSADNKQAAYDQICNIEDANLRLGAFLQALDPNTYLGRIFHTQRGFWKPTYETGFLAKIIRIGKLKMSDVDGLPSSIRDSLLRQPYLLNLFPELRLAKENRHVPNLKAEEKKENIEEKKENTDFDSHESPPAYSSVVSSEIALTSLPDRCNLSSTALMLQASADVIPNCSQVTPGAHLLLPTEQVPVPSAPPAEEMTNALQTFLESTVPSTASRLRRHTPFWESAPPAEEMTNALQTFLESTVPSTAVPSAPVIPANIENHENQRKLMLG
jgi:hypothetical protein